MRTTVKSQSMERIAWKVLIPVCLLFGLILLLTFQSVRDARSLAYRYIEDTAELNVKQTNEDIRKINSEMVYLLYNEKNIMQLPESISPGETAYYDTLDNITTLNRTLRLRYGDSYHFYEYVPGAGLLIIDGSVYFSTSEKTEIGMALQAMVDGYLAGKDKRSEWNYLEAGGQGYLFCFYEVNGKVAGCFFLLEDLFEVFSIRNLGYEGIPCFIMNDGTILTDRGHTEAYSDLGLAEEAGDGGFFWSGVTVNSYQLGRMGQLDLYITSTDDILGRIMTLQVASVVLAVGIVIGVGILVFVYYRKILYPLKQFVARIQDAKEEKWLHETEGNGILELEMASREFKELMREIQSLKIAVYEKELLQNRMELEYVQEQIRPHFYLNCLSIIHGRAERIQAGDIVMICEKLSNYMRYVVNDSNILRTIGEETEHVQDYIDIQKLRYGDAFTFELEAEENVYGYLIPPLVLQVFVENALTHAVTLDSKVEITLYMVVEETEDGESLYICLSDTGRGFDQDVLRRIEEDEEIIYNGRKHVGIQNTRKRLKSIYGEAAVLTLSNMAEHYGAVVELRIPAWKEKGKTDNGNARK